MEYDEVYCTLYNLLIPIQVKSQTAMKTKNTIEKERMIEAEVTQVWDVLTSPVYIEQWLGTKTQSKWIKGSPITFSFSWDGRDFVDKGEIVVLKKIKRFPTPIGVRCQDYLMQKIIIRKLHSIYNRRVTQQN